MSRRLEPLYQMILILVTSQSRFIIQTQHADVKDNAGWEFNIGEDEDFDIEEEMRISSGIGRRRTAWIFLIFFARLYVGLNGYLNL